MASSYGLFSSQAQRNQYGYESSLRQKEAMSGLGQARASGGNIFNNVFHSVGTGDISLDFPTKSLPKGLREELQAETDEWLKGI